MLYSFLRQLFAKCISIQSHDNIELIIFVIFSVNGSIMQKKKDEISEKHGELDTEPNHDSNQIVFSNDCPMIIEGSLAINIKEPIHPEPYEVLIIQKSHSAAVNNIST